MLPVWWQGGYPDIEQLVKNLFQPLLTDVEVVSWLPNRTEYETQLSSGKGYLRIFRTGGKINYDEKRDEPNVQFAALTRSRDDSWELIEFARTGVLEAFMRAAAIVPGTIHKLQCSGEVVGPRLIPEQLRDDRLVPSTFGFYTWQPKSMNYRQHLGI